MNYYKYLFLYRYRAGQCKSRNPCPSLVWSYLCWSSVSKGEKPSLWIFCAFLEHSLVWGFHTGADPASAEGWEEELLLPRSSGWVPRATAGTLHSFLAVWGSKWCLGSYIWFVALGRTQWLAQAESNKNQPMLWIVLLFVSSRKLQHVFWGWCILSGRCYLVRNVLVQ